MRAFILGAAVLLILVGLAVVLYDHPLFQREAEQVVIAPPAEPALDKLPAEPRYPVPEAQPAGASEPAAAEQETAAPTPRPEPEQTLPEILTAAIPAEGLFALLNMENFIQRIVATVDSLPEKKFSRHHLPFKPPGGTFLVTGSSISPANGQRYAPYLQLFETLGTEGAVRLYVQFYPQFQAAYRQLGYPGGHFNDRLVEVIDHLLDTPPVKDPLGVVKPLLVYKYADPQLEELSAGQKLLLRIGAENRLAMLKLLTELKGRLTSLGE